MKISDASKCFPYSTSYPCHTACQSYIALKLILLMKIGDTDDAGNANDASKLKTTE